MSVHQIFYASTAKPTTDDKTLVNILNTAQDFNESHDITGVLLFRSGLFVQLLEGDKTVLQGLYQRIMTDSRHENVNTLFELENDRRLFPDWSMGFERIEALDYDFVKQITDIRKKAVQGQAPKPAEVKKLLMRFQSNVTPTAIPLKR